MKNYIWSKNYIYRLKSYIRSTDWRTICKPNSPSICRLKNYPQIIELSTNRGSIWSAGRRSIYGLKNHLQVKNWSVDQRSIWFADWGIIFRLTNCKSKNYVQIEELNANWKTICRLKNQLPIQECPADRRVIPLADWRMISRSKIYRLTKLFVDWIIFCRSDFSL